MKNKRRLSSNISFFTSKNLLGGLIVLALGALALILSQTDVFKSATKTRAAERVTTTYTAAQAFNEDGSSYGGTWVGNGQSTTKSYLGLRFEGVSIPAGAQIESIKLALTPTADTWISMKAKVYAENAVAPLAFSQSSPPSARTLSSQSVDYDDGTKWIKDTSYEIPSLSNLIPGMTVGSNGVVSFILKGNGSQWGRKYIYGSGDKAPKLTITYVTMAGGPTSPAPSASTTTNPTPNSTPNSTPKATPKATPVASLSPTPAASPITGGTNSHAMGLWNPNTKYDTCTKDEHDGFYVFGPDGKKYPTWHAPTMRRSNGTTCTFGHEHGRNPADSSIYAKAQQQWGYDANGNGAIDGSELARAGIPFGYVNEVLDTHSTSTGSVIRHEDHAGHKVEWAANVPIQYETSSGPRATGVTCNYIVQGHQGTHSRDAFQNNVHEVKYLVSCSDGHEIRLAQMVPFGNAGEFTALCDINGVRNLRTITTGFSYSNPSYPRGPHGSSRQIIDRACANEVMLVPDKKFSGNAYEAWPSNLDVFTKSGKQLVSSINLLFDVEEAVRYYDPAKTDGLAYFVDLCYEVEPNGDRFRGGACSGIPPGVKFDDPRSPFKGLHRGLYLKPGNLDNLAGPSVWYTDPYGKNAQTTPFAGSIKQFIRQEQINYDLKFKGTIRPEVIDRYHDSGSGTVHAPN